jgi:hypothetical protein
MPELSHDDFETAAEPAGTDALGTARQVKRHFGEVSDMWLWRRLRDDPTFPRPLVITGDVTGAGLSFAFGKADIGRLKLLRFDDRGLAREVREGGARRI